MQAQTQQNINKSQYYARYLLIGICVLGVPACSTLPPQMPQPVRLATDIDTSNTSLAKIIQPLRNENPDLTGYHILYDPLEALAARLHLIHQAEKTLDLQYYIWNNDTVGSLALHALLQAADRGVKVRLLIDDNNAKSMEGVFLALDQHPNIEIKLYNPYRFRNYRGVDMVLDLKRINRRMHNKTFIVDNQLALIGGRNMGNHYYNVSDTYQFSDVDVILAGSAADEIIESFDDYWNDSYAYPVRQIVDGNLYTLRFDGLKEQLNAHYQEQTVQNFLDLAYRSKKFETWLKHNIQLDWVKAEVVKDSPDKIRGTAPPEDFLNAQLLSKLDEPKQSVDIISAYFVPEKIGTKKLTELAQSGVNVRILTNSFQANDISVVHAFYSKYRQQLLENNVELYEFIYTPAQQNLYANTEEISEKAHIKLKGLSRSSLHAKLMALDGEQVFIGSYNFDPRSARVNTEIGVLLNSPELAQGVHQTMTENLPKYAYKLVLDANNKINWQLKKSEYETTTLRKEPKMKWYKKVGQKLVSWLPIEGFM